MIEISNRKAYHDYEISETYECGIVLTGTEIKSIRLGKAQLKDSYAIVRNNEAFLLNMHISHYDKGNQFNHDEERTRKLLLHKKEILKLNDNIKIEGYTIVPLKLYFKKNKVKILVGVARGKKLFDKRDAMKKKDMQMEMKKAMKKEYI